jgi:hypothetical protein
MKGGRTESALMNYNTVTEEMVFNQNNKMLALTSLETIDTIYLNNCVFIPVAKKFYELAYKGPIPLFVQHKSNLSSAGKPSGYGGTSQTSSITNIASLSSGGAIYNLRLPEDFVATNASMYWIKLNDKWSSFLNDRQLTKILPEKKEEIKSVVKAKKIDFDKADEVKSLIALLNSK